MTKPRMDARRAFDDIRSGMNDAAFIKKYGISVTDLKSLFAKYLDSGSLGPPTIDKTVTRPETGGSIDGKVSHLDGESPEPMVVRRVDRKRVLVMSNDCGFLDLLGDLLTRRDVRTLTCADEIPGIEDLDRMNPDLVVVDLDFPGINADDVLNKVKQIDDCIPVILVADSKNRAAAMGPEGDNIHGIVEKSFPSRALLRVVMRGLEYGELARFKRNHLRAMEEAIQEKTMEIVRTKDFLQGILSSSTLVSVVLTDLDQNVLFWNTGAENIFGYKANEIVGTKITRLYPADSLSTETVEQLRSMVQRGTGTVQGKMKQIAKDGRVLTVSLAISPMLDAFGTIQGILGVGLDVTEETRQQEEIVRLLSLVQKTQEVSIFTLAKLADSRDEETGFHLNRIQQYCRLLCIGLARLPGYRDIVTPGFTDDLYQSSVLHDIGKVAIPDSILKSTEKFGPNERKIMEQHPVVGGRALEEAVTMLGEKSLLTIGMEVAYYHHEHWDGSGYPFGIKGQEIPLSARIVAVADVYDALTTRRRYKRAFSHEETCGLIVEKKGKQFDPDIVGVFQDMAGEFRKVRDKFMVT